MSERSHRQGGRFGWRGSALPAEPDELRNMELVDVLSLLGRPTMALALGDNRRAVAWTKRGRLVEIVFDEHARAEHISLT